MAVAPRADQRRAAEHHPAEAADERNRHRQHGPRRLVVDVVDCHVVRVVAVVVDGHVLARLVVAELVTEIYSALVTMTAHGVHDLGFAVLPALEATCRGDLSGDLTAVRTQLVTVTDDVVRRRAAPDEQRNADQQPQRTEAAGPAYDGCGPRLICRRRRHCEHAVTVTVEGVFPRKRFRCGADAVDRHLSAGVSQRLLLPAPL